MTAKTAAKAVRKARAKEAPDSARPGEEAGLLELAGARLAIEAVAPEIEGGRYPAKAVAGGSLTVEADIFCDGHDVIDAAVFYRPQGEAVWREAPMR